MKPVHQVRSKNHFIRILIVAVLVAIFVNGCTVSGHLTGKWLDQKNPEILTTNPDSLNLPDLIGRRIAVIKNTTERYEGVLDAVELKDILVFEETIWQKGQYINTVTRISRGELKKVIVVDRPKWRTILFTATGAVIDTGIIVFMLYLYEAMKGVEATR